MADPWRIAHTEEKGRHLLAISPIAPGRLVLEQAPYAAVLYDDQLPIRCDYTLADDVTLQRCSGCKVVSYRDKRSQRAAWKEGHREECAALIKLAPRLPPATVRLAARVLWRRAREQRLDGSARDGTDTQSLVSSSPPPPGPAPDIDSLEDHWNLLDDERKTLYAQMAVLTREYMMGCLNPEAVSNPKEIAMLLARFACNNHTICDDELRPLGVGIYPLGAMINHSCDPSAVQSFSGTSVQFRAIRPIKQGEEISISYIDLAAPRPQRRRDLLHQYFFDIDPRAGPAPQPASVHELTMESHGAAGEVQVHGRQPPSPVDVGREALTALTGSRAQHGGMMAELMAPPEPVSDSFGVLADGDEGIAALSAAYPGAATSRDITVRAPQVVEVVPPIDAVESHVVVAAPQLQVSCWGASFMASGSQLPHPAWQVATDLAGRLLTSQQRADDLVKQGRAAEAMTLLQGALDNVGEGSVKLAPMHCLRMRAVAGLMRAAIAGGDWAAALVAARTLLPYYQLVYPTVWPDLGLHWASMAKLSSVLGHDSEAATAAEAACRVLSITHGGGRVVNEMMQLRHEIGQQMAMGRND